jgi:hypothetical protein
MTPRVTAFCGTRKIILIRLVPHSLHIAQQLDLCVFRLFTIICRKEKQSKEMKGETRKFYRALSVFYKSTIIPMVRWNCEGSGFRLHPDNLLGPLTVDATPVLERLDVPELPFDDALIYPGRLDPQ